MQNQVISGALDTNGNFFPLDSCNKAYAYNINGDYLTITATFNGSVWVRTYTYDAPGRLQNETGWVKQ